MPIQVLTSGIQAKENTVTYFVESINCLLKGPPSYHSRSFSLRILLQNNRRNPGSYTGGPLSETIYFDSFPSQAFLVFWFVCLFFHFLGHLLLWKQRCQILGQN